MDVKDIDTAAVRAGLRSLNVRGGDRPLADREREAAAQRVAAGTDLPAVEARQAVEAWRAVARKAGRARDELLRAMECAVGQVRPVLDAAVLLGPGPDGAESVDPGVLTRQVGAARACLLATDPRHRGERVSGEASPFGSSPVDRALVYTDGTVVDPGTVDVVCQWWENGDHPEDAAGRATVDPVTGESKVRVEGDVVRFYRPGPDPGDPGTVVDLDEVHSCGYPLRAHGWLDPRRDGNDEVVCPGDYVVSLRERELNSPDVSLYRVARPRPTVAVMPGQDTGGTVDLSGAMTAEEAVFQALGAASMCWEDVAKAGVFKSRTATRIGNELLAWFRAHPQDGRPAAGERVIDGDQAGTLAWCEKCGGNGVVVQLDPVPESTEPLGLDPAVEGHHVIGGVR